MIDLSRLLDSMMRCLIFLIDKFKQPDIFDSKFCGMKTKSKRGGRDLKKRNHAEI